MLVFDTTVLVYAKGASHELRGPCRRLISAVASGKIVATTTPEAIQEFTHVRARRRDRVEAAGLARDYAELLSPLLDVDRGILDRGLDLYVSVPQLGAFDAVLASAAIEAGATGIVSADRDFARLAEVEHLMPGEAGLNRLLE